MSDDESNQPIQKIFNQYQIKITSNLDYISVIIQNNNNFTIYESKFNLEYLHQFKLLMGNLTIDEMINFINDLIEKKAQEMSNIYVRANKLRRLELHLFKKKEKDILEIINFNKFYKLIEKYKKKLPFLNNVKSLTK